MRVPEIERFGEFRVLGLQGSGAMGLRVLGSRV